MYRTKLLLLGIFIAMALVMVACGGKTNGSTDNSIVIVIPEDPPSFNPAIADSGYDYLVMELVLLGLADMDPEGNIFPELATELPTIENGGVVVDEDNWTMTATWKLRQDVKWSDGTPLTANDVIFTYQAIIDPETGGWVPGIDYVDDIQKVDDYTFTVYFNTVYPGYLTLFGGEQAVIWPAHYCDATQGFANWDCGRQPLSSGPYVLKEWINGDHMTFVKNANYHVPGKPAIEVVTVRIVPDESVRKTMLVNGDADLDMWTTESVIADLQGEPNVIIEPSPTNRWVMRLFFNLAAKGTTDPVAAPHPILSDVRVRRAIRMGIDVDTISKEFFLGMAQPAWTEFFREPYKCDIPRPKFDIEGAKALLDEAGWKDTDGDGIRECRGCTTGAPEGYVMEMEFLTYAEYGEALNLTQQFIAEKMRAIGIKLNLGVVEGSVLWAYSADGGIEQSGNFDMDIWDDGYSGNDPLDHLWSFYYSEAVIPDYGYNYGRWINPDFDALLDEAYTLDEEYRQELFCQMAAILEDELPQALLFTAVNADAHSARLVGVRSTTNDIVTWNVADWTLK